jgi:hypothetical protein
MIRTDRAGEYHAKDMSRGNRLTAGTPQRPGAGTPNMIRRGAKSKHGRVVGAAQPAKELAVSE